MPGSPAQPTPARVTINRGLEGQDDNIDLLQSYFKELKAVTVEPSAPDVDFLTFAICTHYFGVITMTPSQQHVANDNDAEGEQEKVSLDAGYVVSPPPPSWISSKRSFASTHSAIRFEKKAMHSPSPEEEKVLKWREAFLAQLQEGDGEEEHLLSKGKMRIHDLGDYINWPDDIPSDECSNDPHVQGDQLDHEQLTSPVEMSEIHPDSKLQAIMHEEAIKYPGLLRAQRIKAYQGASASRPLFIQPSFGSQSTPIGIIYLASSQTVDDPMHRGQLNLGIYVAPNYIEQPGLVPAVKEVVNEAFQDTSCHRVQAIVVDHKTKFDTLKLYTSSGFSREGVGRREFFSPITHEWKDVFYFAILATEWLFDNSDSSSLARPLPKTLWDDLLICQQREREELLKMEEKTLERSPSIETIRNKASSIASTSRSETSSVANSSIGAATTNSSIHKGSPKRKRTRAAKKAGTDKPRASSTSTSSSIGTFETMSTISSEWEIPSPQDFGVPATNGTNGSSSGGRDVSNGK